MMFLKQFRIGLQEYGYLRLAKSPDFLIAFFGTVIIHFAAVPFCQFAGFDCSDAQVAEFIELGTQMTISLTAFILAGLAVLISFTDREFLLKLEELGIYTNIMFVFQYNLYLAGLTSVIGILIQTFTTSTLSKTIFLFLFTYTVFSIAAMVDLIVRYGKQKGKFETNRKQA